MRKSRGYKKGHRDNYIVKIAMKNKGINWS